MKNIDIEKLTKNLLKYFLQGLAIIGPIGLTFFVIWQVFTSIDNIIPSLARKIPGLVFISTILLTALLGFLGDKFVFGRFIFDQIDTLLEKAPGIKHIYTPTKEVMSSFVGDKKKFSHPVWVKVNDSPIIWRVGFLTQNDLTELGEENLVAVYMPHSYAISGWVIITDRNNVRPIPNVSAASAMKFAVSGGIAGFHTDDNIFKAPE